MSLKALVWVINDAPVEKQSHLCILMALADTADDSGRNSWPSVETLARKSRCSQRTVHRHLKDMEKEGFIRRGNQEIVAKIPVNRRPIVWDICMPSTPNSWGDKLTPQAHSGVTKTPSRGDNAVAIGVTAVADKQSNKHIELNTPIPLKGNEDDPQNELTESGFQAFANAYPVNTRIVRARTSYVQALSFVTHDQLLAEVENQRDLIIFYQKPAYRWLRDSNYLDPLPKPAHLVMKEQTEHYLRKKNDRPSQKPPDNLHEMFKKAGRPDLYPKKEKTTNER
ncbi:MAG: helix-turn-helix domain-containing protein [Lawsonella sp.]